MDRYKLVNPKNFFGLFDEINLDWGSSKLKEIIVTPEINLWQITLLTEKNFDKNFLTTAQEFLQKKYGAQIEIHHEVLNADEFIPAEKNSSSKKNFSAGNEKRTNGNGKRGEKFSETVTKISDVKEDETVTIVGEVGGGDKNGVSLREFKNGTICVSFAVTDDSDGIVCKKFFKADKKSGAQPFADQLKAGMLVKISADAKYDEYTKENVLFINALEPQEKNSAARVDTAEVKRVELHVHTQMSAMDAVIPVEKLIKTAADWNWSAVAITDHGVIQAFPNAALTAEKLAKAGKKNQNHLRHGRLSCRRRLEAKICKPRHHPRQE